jgi:nitrite reductase/ring-hydroxylating ferredoxin subunit
VHERAAAHTGRFRRPEPRLAADVAAGDSEGVSVWKAASEGSSEMESATAVKRLYAGEVGDLEPGESCTVAGEVSIALYRTDDGEYFATADSCTHEEWSLGEDSDLEGDQVVCPLHLARFDLRTGEALCFPASIALRTYAVEIEDGKVYIHDNGGDARG